MLCKSRVANVAFVGFFTGMDSNVALQLGRVGAGVRAMVTIIRSLSGMLSHMPPKLGQLDAPIITFRASVRLLLGVLVLDMADQLSRGRKFGRTVFALVRFAPGVRPDMVLERGQFLEASLAKWTLVRSIIRMNHDMS